MTERLWLFPAILCLLLSITFFEVFSIIGLVLSVIWFIRIFLLKNRFILVLSVVIGVSFLGVAYLHQQTNQTHFQGNEEQFVLYPQVTSIKVDGDRVRFEGVAQNGSAKERLVLSYYLESEDEKQQWLENPPKTHLVINGMLKVPGEQTNFNQFNYRKYLQRNNIHWQLDVKDIHRISGDYLEKPIGAFLENMRFSIFQYIDRVFNSKIASYIKTLFFADNRSFSEEMLQHYRSLGIVHLFSISGFHISYLVHLIRQTLLRLGITHERTNLLLILILPIYGGLAGFGVSVFRAVFQNIFVLLSKTRNQPLDTIDAWALTMILALFINPAQIYNISFQLSYTLSGIFILMGKQKWTSKLNPFSYSLLFSLMSGLASIPILTYHFFEISWITTLSNLLFIPFFSNVLFPLLLLLFLISFVLKESFLFIFTEQMLLLLIRFVEETFSLLTTHFDFTFVTGRLPAVVMLVLIISIYKVLIKIENKELPHLVSLTLVGMALFYHQLSPIGYVIMLDVGQGDSILIKEPITRKITLIDTGGKLQWGEREQWQDSKNPFSIGTDIVVPSLKSLGISEIDRLYITHADTDHSGEIKRIADNLTIKEIATTKEVFKDPLIYEQVIPFKDIERVLITPPEIINYPVRKTLAIHPKPINYYQDKNNQSLVLYVTLGEDNWLFTGDIEIEAERDLVNGYPNLRVDYLKVSHHGSQTSSTEEFINHVKPKVALISVGADNQFGHPHNEVMDRFQEKKIVVHSTGVDGAIMFRYLNIPFTDYWLKDLQTVHKN